MRKVSDTDLRANKMKSLGRRYLAAQTAVFLWLVPQLTMFLNDDNRYYYNWEFRDALSLFGCLVLPAIACVLAGELLRLTRSSLLNRAFNHLFVIALGAGLLNNLAYHFTRPVGYSISQFGMEIQTGWLILLAMVGYSFARPELKLVLRCRQLCQLTSPVMLIVAYQLFTAGNYPVSRDPIPIACERIAVDMNKTGQPSPIYLFIFDEWSYERTYPNGQLRPTFSNLAELSQQAIVFHDAHSPGKTTKVSLPRILFQTDLPVYVDNGRVGFEKDGQFLASRECESIFSLVDKDRYHSMIVGFYLPYTLWLGDQVDICRSYPWRTHGDGAVDGMGLHIYKALEKSTDPWFRFVSGKLSLYRDKRYQYLLGLHNNISRDMEEIIRQGPRDTFAVIHYPLPHNPYIFKADGSPCTPDTWRYTHTLDTYLETLEYLDKFLIGKAVATMKTRGTFDDALLIITSDHSWHSDPDKQENHIDSEATHVPLIVKLPGQQSPFSTNSPFVTSNLGSLITHVLKTDGDLDSVKHVLEPAIANLNSRILTLNPKYMNK